MGFAPRSSADEDKGIRVRVVSRDGQRQRTRVSALLQCALEMVLDQVEQVIAIV